MTNTVLVGPREALEVTWLEAVGASWCGRAPAPGDRVGVQVRAHGEEILATVQHVDDVVSPASLAGGEVGPGVLRMQLDRPLTGVAPGQTLALYDGTRVVGAATITAARA